MKKIMIEGMSCHHCSAAVQEALEELGIQNVEVDLKGGFALADTDLPKEKLVEAVEEAGYEVLEILEV